jgi:hypothetical protein
MSVALFASAKYVCTGRGGKCPTLRVYGLKLTPLPESNSYLPCLPVTRSESITHIRASLRRVHGPSALPHFAESGKGRETCP